MKRRFSVLAIFLTLCILFAACGNQTGETAPSAEPTTAPTEPTTAPTEPTTAPTEPTIESTAAPTVEPTTEPSPEPSTEPPHTHNLSLYDYDHAGHLYGCLCGERIYEPHTLDKAGNCAVCGRNVRVAENGHYVVTTVYDSGITARIEAFYQPIEPGSDEFYHYLSYYYDSDDYWRIIEYGTHSHITSITSYDPDGNVTYVETRTYEFYEHGGYDLDCFWDGVLYQERSYILGPDGRHHETLLIDYDMTTGEPDRIVIYEYEVGETIQMTYSRIERSGYILSESFYEKNKAGEYYLSRRVYYDQDGNIKEEFHYSEN